MLQLGERDDFASEARDRDRIGARGLQELDRDRPCLTSIPSVVHRGHPATLILAQLLFDDIPTGDDRPDCAHADSLTVPMLKRCLPLAVFTIAGVCAACASHRPRPITIAAPADSEPARYMASSASYVCQPALLYEISGPKVQGCARQSGDTTWLVDRDKDDRVLAAGYEIMVPLDQLAYATEILEASLTRRYGSADSCVSRTGTLKRWLWWPAGRYTVQARMVDPSPLYAVKRGRLEVQAIPAEAVVCMTWIHTPTKLFVP